MHRESDGSAVMAGIGRVLLRTISKCEYTVHSTEPWFAVRTSRPALGLRRLALTHLMPSGRPYASHDHILIHTSSIHSQRSPPPPNSESEVFANLKAVLALHPISMRPLRPPFRMMPGTFQDSRLFLFTPHCHSSHARPTALYALRQCQFLYDHMSYSFHYHLPLPHWNTFLES